MIIEGHWFIDIFVEDLDSENKPWWRRDFSAYKNSTTISTKDISILRLHKA